MVLYMLNILIIYNSNERILSYRFLEYNTKKVPNKKPPINNIIMSKYTKEFIYGIS